MKIRSHLAALCCLTAGRLGARTVLVESAVVLGGNLTLGGVEHPDPFRKNAQTVIGGIGLEWTMKTVALGRGAAAEARAGRPLEPDRLTLKENFDPWTFVCVGEELLRDAGVDLRYYETPVMAERLAGPDYNWRVLTGVQGGLREIRCRQLVDATGNGGLAGMCGAAFLPVDGEAQGGSLHYRLTGVPDPKDLPEGLLARRLAEAHASGALRDGDNHGGDVGDALILRWQAANYVYGAGRRGLSPRLARIMNGMIVIESDENSRFCADSRGIRIACGEFSSGGKDVFARGRAWGLDMGGCLFW